MNGLLDGLHACRVLPFLFIDGFPFGGLLGNFFFFDGILFADSGNFSLNFIYLLVRLETFDRKILGQIFSKVIVFLNFDRFVEKILRKFDNIFLIETQT